MWHRDPSHHPVENGSGRVEQASGRSSGGATEDMVRERRNFQEDVDRREKRNKEDRKPANQLHGRKRARGWEAQGAKHEISDDIDHRRGDDLVEGILNEAPKPAPEEPLHLRDDKERNENGSHEHANGSSNKTVGDNHNRDRLSRGK